MSSLLRLVTSSSTKLISSGISSIRGISHSKILQTACPEPQKQATTSSPCAPPPCPPPPCPACPGPNEFFTREIETKLNEQIAIEFMAFYNYLGIFNHFSRSVVGLKGCRDYFLNCAEEEKRHAMRLCNYQAERGGCVQLMDIEKPCRIPCTVKDAFNYSLQMEKKITEKLLELKCLAKKCDDSVTHDLIVNEFIKNQVFANNWIFLTIFFSTFFLLFQFKTIHELNGYMAKLELLKGSDAGIYEFDRDLEKSLGKHACNQAANDSLFNESLNVQ